MVYFYNFSNVFLGGIVVRTAKHRSRRPRVTIHWREAGQGARRAAAAEPPASPGTATLHPWHGQRIKIEDLAGFTARWGLVAVGSDWPEGEPCPRLYLAEVQGGPAMGGPGEAGDGPPPDVVGGGQQPIRAKEARQ
jgi:hypothetical protein